MTINQIYPSGRPNVLVTGGAGFIGSHLCDDLIKKYNVICLDNFSTGQEKNIDHLLENPHFEFIKHDIIEPLKLEEFLELAKFQINVQGIQEIYNLACPTSPKDYEKYPIETILANSEGMKNILELTRHYQAKLLHASSDAVYGEPPTDGLLYENNWGNVNPLSPRAPYLEGKRFAETMCKTWAEEYNLDIKIIRIFATYGPRMRLADGRLIPDLITSALKGESLKIYGDETAAGTFCYISDTIDGLTRMMQSGHQGPFNIGSDEVYKYRDIARKILELTNTQAEIVHQEPLPFMTRQGVPDTSLARERIGWLPLMKIDKGLATTIEYMKAHLYLE